MEKITNKKALERGLAIKLLGKHKAMKDEHEDFALFRAFFWVCIFTAIFLGVAVLYKLYG